MTKVVIPVPKTLYKCVVADPPWTYYNKWNPQGNPDIQQKELSDGRKTMTLEEIRETNVKEITDPNGSVLFLWATMPLLEDAMDVLNAWGFTYKTAIIWEKVKWARASGRWFKTITEICLVGTRGDVRPFGSRRYNVLHVQPSRRSRKPEEFFELINPIIQYHGLTPCIEIFTRTKRPQWDSWDNGGGMNDSAK